MPRHVSLRDWAQLGQMLRSRVKPDAALKKLQLARCKKRTKGPSKSGVYAFWKGKTYSRGAAERRGRKPKAPPGIARIADKERLSLIKDAETGYRVTRGDGYKATKKALKAKGALTRRLQMHSKDWLCRALREAKVRSRPGRKRISRKEEHEKKRYEQA